MSAEVPVAYTMVERPALTPLVLHACLLPTTSVSAIEAAAAGVATSSLVAECTSQMASVILPAQHPFWSVMCRVNRICEFIIIDMLMCQWAKLIITS